MLTLGNFDGVHRGHLALIARARVHAEALGLPLAVMSFEPTPREYFAPDRAPLRVSNLRSKLADLQSAGVDEFWLLRFGRELASCSAHAFAEHLLAERLQVRAVVIGDDFRYGEGRQGDYDRLCADGARLGFSVDSVPTVLEGTRRCSSTALRALLGAGDLQLAEVLLGRPYRLCGRVRQGLRLGRELGMPTANLPLKRPLALRRGVYAVELTCDGRLLPGVANYGVRPTLGGTPALLEVHCLVPPGDLYGREIAVRFRHFLRDEARFPSLDALRAQMLKDRESATAWFAQFP